MDPGGVAAVMGGSADSRRPAEVTTGGTPSLGVPLTPGVQRSLKTSMSMKCFCKNCPARFLHFVKYFHTSAKLLRADLNQE